MSRVSGPAVVALAGLLLLSACGGDGGGDGATLTVESATPTPEPGVVLEEEEADQSDVSYVDNLLAKVDAGEWTLGEGLVATLKLFAGEIDAASVLRHPDLADYEGTGIVWMAREYLETGPDAAARAEIARLLGLLVFSNEQLEAMAGLDRTAGLPGRLGLHSSRAQELDCQTFFAGYEVPAGIGQCLESQSLVIYGKLHRVFYPAPPLPSAGWTEAHYDLALQAIEETVQVYEPLGELPPVNLVFSVAGGGDTWAIAAPTAGEACGIALFTSMQNFPEGDFKQVVAHELAHCFSEETFTEQNKVGYEIIKWREEGMAEYLSNVAYPSNNLEWKRLDKLAKVELQTTLLDRSYGNFIWFQHLGSTLGNDGLFAVIRALPESERLPESESARGRADQEAALANARPGMGEVFQEFVQALTDQAVQDTSGVNIPYLAPSRTITIGGPRTPMVQGSIKVFGTVRLRVAMAEDDKRAALAFSPTGLPLEGARPAGGDEWSSIPAEFPTSELECGGIIVVVTATEPGSAFRMGATDVSDAPGLGCDRCLIGAWDLNNDVWAEMGSSDPEEETITIAGTLTVTFGEDGHATWTFADFARTHTVGPGGAQPGRQSTITTSGGGSQWYSTRTGNLLTFSGPEIHVFSTETGDDRLLEGILTTGISDAQTTFAYDCDGDRLITVVSGFEIEWNRVR